MLRLRRKLSFYFAKFHPMRHHDHLLLLRPGTHHFLPRRPRRHNNLFCKLEREIQAAFLGWLISSIYKAFTGRAHPELLAKNVLDVGTVFLNGTQDITHQFQFGFLRGGIFWGWPSSHTAVAFAIALCLLILFREPRKTKILVLLAAVYIGLGVSISIHWFSDFVAGAIVGSVVGMTVGKSFLTRFKQQL